VIVALLVEHFEVDPVVLRHDETLRRKAFPGLSHQKHPQEIHVDDMGDLAIDAYSFARELRPGHDVTWISVVSMAVFISHLPFDEHVVAWLT
jgi:hypothetical protein